MNGTGPTIDILRSILAAFNAHDLDAIMALCTEDVVLEMPRGPHPWGARAEGAAAVRALLATRFSGLPDVSYNDDTHHVAGALGISQWTLRGTEAGTGRRIEVRGCDLLTFRGDKVAKKDSYWKIVQPASS
jgi:ketosteroid isomerase-like protein